MRDGVIVLPSFILPATNKRRIYMLSQPSLARLDLSKGGKDGTITISEYRYKLFVLYNPNIKAF